jgi:hypothetical protein
MYNALKCPFRSVSFAIAIFAALVLSGCVTTTETARGPLVTQSSNDIDSSHTSQRYVQPPSANRAALVPPADAPETCDEQLQDICDALLQYYARKRQLPEKLEDLRPFAIEGRQLRFTCPVSGKPYLYDRGGPTLNQSTWLTNARGQPVQMSQPNTTGQLIIYDAEAVHDGQRWCIVFGRDIRGNGMRADPCRIPEASLAQALNAAHGTTGQ